MSEFNRNNNFQIPSNKWKGPSRAMLRKAHRAQVLPGFPVEKPFASVDEVRQYLSGDKLQCLLCGKMFRGLGCHVALQHGVPADEYKVRYGIPYGYGLAAESTKQKHRDVQAARLNDNPGLKEALRERAAKARLLPKDYRPLIATVKSQRIERISQPKEYTSCFSCGVDVAVAGGRTKCKQCKAKTKQAHAATATENKKRHYYKDIERSRELLRQRAARVRAKKRLAAAQN